MERSFHDAQKEIATVFHRIDKDLSTLNGRANRRAEGEVNLAKEVQKDRDQQWKLSQRLEALEAREQDRELRIALQEDQIQELQREVDELQGKMCRCHEQSVPSTQPVEEDTGGEGPWNQWKHLGNIEGTGSICLRCFHQTQFDYIWNATITCT